ncbi:MAG: hypothetical protein PVF33_10320 [Candidatus Latescibacterota bacterium]|jgi:hypothetical protein
MAAQVESSGKSIALMALYVVIGIPLVGYIWNVLNELLALNVNTTRLLIAIPVAIVLFFYLKFVSKKLRETFQSPEGG